MLAKDAPIEILDRVVIAGGFGSRHRAMNAAAAVAPNADLLVAYHESTDHHRTMDGALILARSMDGGYTWPIKTPLFAEPGWDCYTNHGMARLSDGTLLLHTIRGRRYQDSTGKTRAYIRGSWTRSTDNGYHWQERGSEMDYPFLSRGDRGMSYGLIQELSDGRLMAPFYGVPSSNDDDSLRVAAVAFSSDGGYSWPDYSIIYEDRNGDVNPSETDIIQLADGRYLAMLRANAALRLFRSYSCDEGRTWTSIEATELPGQCPALIYLTSGDILCAYRDMRPEACGMSCAVSGDMGQSWTPLGSLYRGANWDCAYPSLVRLSDDTIFTPFYTAADPEPMTGTCELHGLIIQDESAS